LLKVRSAVDALEQRVESAVTSRDASQLRVCVAELERHTLTLDELRSDNDAIRTARKAEVTRIQSLLAQLDAASGSL
jgi:FtsZ-binding cell division protein ZapB